MPARQNLRRPEIAIATVAFAVYAAFSWRPAWSGDEAATVVVVRSDWATAWWLALDDAALGPYYLLMKPWAAVSSSQLWMRLPSLAAAAASVALVYLLVRRVSGPRAAAVSAAVLVVLPVMSRYGAMARPYAFAVLACVVVVSCWWHHVETGRLLSGIGTAAGIIATGLAHVYALLVVVPLLGAALIAPMHGRRQDLRRTVLPLAGGVALLAPWLWHVLTTAKGSPNPGQATPLHVARGLLRLTFMTGPTTHVLLVGACLLGLATVGFARGWLRAGRERTLAVLAALWLTRPPFALAAFQEVTDKPGVVLRYWAFCVPAMAIGIGLALGRPGRRWGVLALCVLSAVALVSLPAHRGIRGPDALSGTKYLSVLEVMSLPQLDSAPLLVRGPLYRGSSPTTPLQAPGFPSWPINPAGHWTWSIPTGTRHVPSGSRPWSETIRR